MYSTTRLESNSSSSSQAFLNSLEDPMKEDVYSNFENVSFFDQQWNTLDFNFLEQYNQMFFDTPNNVEPVTPYKSTVYPSHTELDDLLVTNPTYDKSPLGKVSWRQSIFLEKKPKEIQECHISWTSSPSPVPTKINSIVSSTSEPLPERHDHLVSQEIFPNNTNLYEPKAWVAMPRRQKPRYEGDHYTPKWVRYTGHLKQGYCDSCSPGKWLQLKNSAYW
ncbi:hypothetical protein G6F56_010302 [Rhizopus delemar]|nr:hypothetical protein G6F56_010302 [Rhizopus delemar]